MATALIDYGCVLKLHAISSTQPFISISSGPKHLVEKLSRSQFEKIALDK